MTRGSTQHHDRKHHFAPSRRIAHKETAGVVGHPGGAVDFKCTKRRPWWDARTAVFSATSCSVPRVEKGAPQMVVHFDLAGRDTVSESNMVVEEATLQKGFLPDGLIHHLFGFW